jgi:hypothetical protein
MTAPTFYERVLARLALKDPAPEDPAELERWLRTGIRELSQRPPSAELEKAAFLIGDWETGGEVYATATTPGFRGRSPFPVRWTRTLRGHSLKCTETAGEEDGGSVSYLHFDPDLELWVSLYLEPNVASVRLISRGWAGDRLVFEPAEVSIVGDVATWRKTLVRVSEDEHRWENDELRPDGSWLPIDQHWFRRVAPDGSENASGNLTM